MRVKKWENWKQLCFSNSHSTNYLTIWLSIWFNSIKCLLEAIVLQKACLENYIFFQKPGQNLFFLQISTFCAFPITKSEHQDLWRTRLIIFRVCIKNFSVQMDLLLSKMIFQNLLSCCKMTYSSQNLLCHTKKLRRVANHSRQIRSWNVTLQHVCDVYYKYFLKGKIR